MRHGSQLDPPNRFDSHHRVSDLEHVEWDQEFLRQIGNRQIEYIADTSKSIISENDSPDVPFRYSLNPYRGCIHGCAYCYARPSHEFLGFNAGLDFETRIVVKHNAAKLLRDFLARDTWQPEPIAFSGVTDCYQPAERQFRLTRGCLELALECCQPVGIVTKNALILRDLDILKPMAERNLIHVLISITSLDTELVRDMEPRTSTPEARQRAMRELADAGIPVGLLMAPVILGLNDSEIPAVLQAAKDAGAAVAGCVMLRLPLSVEPVFREWLQRTQPLKEERILGRVRSTRDGKLNSSEWGRRMSGTGEIADQIRSMFQLFRQKLQLDGKLPEYDCSRFCPPVPGSGQLRLF